MMIEKIQSNWEEIISYFREEWDISNLAYNTWIAPTTLDYYETKTNGMDILHITIPNPDFVNYVNSKYSKILSVAIEQVIAVSCDVIFEIKKEKPKNNKKITLINPIKKEVSHLVLSASNLNPSYTFNTFVVGKSNNLAHAASLNVANNPGHKFNPLFIYGGVGLGKTHLMHSIAHHILENNPQAKILYVSSEKFTNDYVDAIKNNNRYSFSTSDFRSKYREVDVLLIDDIQFIKGKEGTQEELFHTFNALYDAKKQIILSADKPVKELKDMEERLRSRFEWGLPVDIQSPDYETRMAILRKKEEKDGTNIDNEVIQYIAANITSNIRELEGALTKIVAMSRLEKNREIDITLASEVLKDIISPHMPKKITPNYIIEIVCEHFNVSVEELKAKNRAAHIVRPRHIAMFLCRQLTNATQSEIGKILGNRDHSTVINGEKSIMSELEKDTELIQTVDVIKKKISPQ